MWCTSQEAGNMMSGRPAARSAPGTDPVTPLPPAKDQGDPHVTPSNAARIDPGDDGKPPARTITGAPDLPRPAWKTTR
jgi:hypothetical protein